MYGGLIVWYSMCQPLSPSSHTYTRRAWSPLSQLLSSANRLPYWSKASSCGFRRPRITTSKFVPSGSQRNTAPVRSPANGLPSFDVTLNPRSPTVKYSLPSGPKMSPCRSWP